MFLCREIDIKLCPIYTQISYMQFCKNVSTDHIQQIQNQTENDDILQKPENLRFAPILII